MTETRDKKQAVVVMGFPGTTLDAPDRYALELVQEACIAMTQALDELYGPGYANLDAEDAHFEAVTVADTRDVAAKYLRAEEAVVAVVRPQCVAEEVGTIADGVSDSTYCTVAEWRLV